MPSPTQQQIALASFARIRTRSFADVFYKKFFAADPRIAPYFAKTNWQEQKKMLTHGIYMLLAYSSGQDIGRSALQRLGVLHREHMHIPADLYSAFLEAVLATAAELDEQWSPELARQWRADLERGIAFMQTGREA